MYKKLMEDESEALSKETQLFLLFQGSFYAKQSTKNARMQILHKQKPKTLEREGQKERWEGRGGGGRRGREREVGREGGRGRGREREGETDRHRHSGGERGGVNRKEQRQRETDTQRVMLTGRDINSAGFGSRLASTPDMENPNCEESRRERDNR